jgi:UDP-N-acetyl-2-amino-2-deoxyglucuronate dehydrogenase
MNAKAETGGGVLRVGLVGAGGFGIEIAKMIARLPELELAGVADVDIAAARALGEEYGAPAWADHTALLAECDCAAVAVSTPHNTHRDIVLAVAVAGKHIFCEKAMAINVAECNEMIRAAEANDVRLMVAHKRRLRPAYAEIKRLLDGGEFGRPMAINVAGYFGRTLTGWWNSREACGGLIYWAGVHDIDTIRHLLGEVSRVHAVTGPKLYPDITDYEDSIAITLEFASGAVGSVQVSTFYPMATYRTSFDYEIVCENGGIAYDSRQVAIHSQLKDRPPTTTFFEGYGHDVAYDEEWSSFAAWVLRGEPPVLTGEDGLRCVEIMQAAYISVANGAPVDLPLAADDRRPWG